MSSGRDKKYEYEATIIAGSGVEGCEDGIPSRSKFHTPRGLAFDELTNTCYVADFGNRSIRKFSFV